MLTMEKYVYGMRLRGFSIGCQPMEGWEERRDDFSGRYFDILVYRQKLNEAKLRNYELDYLGTLAEYEAKCRSIY